MIPSRIEPGDFVEDVVRNPTVKGRVLKRDDERPHAFFVKFANGITASVGAEYLRKLEKKS